MKKVWKFWLVLLLTLGLVAGGAYYSKGQILQDLAVIAEPRAVISEETKKHEEQEKQEKTENQERPKATSNGWINILVLGTDNEGDEVARSDLMMFVSANVDRRQVSVISIPRDTRVNILGVGLTKINHANALGELNGDVYEGTLESVKAVSNLLGVTMNYYVKIDFQGFRDVVDAVGGVDLNLPSPVKDQVQEIDFLAGENHLTGDQALRLARARYGLPKGDFDRQQNHFDLLSALGHQLLSVSNILKFPEVLNILHQALIDTNLSKEEMMGMGFAFMGITKEAIEYYQLPGQETIEYDPLVGERVYFFEPDPEGIREILQEAIAL